jgi:hypothetical protein
MLLFVLQKTTIIEGDRHSDAVVLEDDGHGHGHSHEHIHSVRPIFFFLLPLSVLLTLFQMISSTLTSDSTTIPRIPRHTMLESPSLRSSSPRRLVPPRLLPHPRRSRTRYFVSFSTLSLSRNSMDFAKLASILHSLRQGSGQR